MNDTYDFIKDYFHEIEDAEVNHGKGAQGIKYRGKMFAMFYKGDLTLKFSPERVKSLIESGVAQPHDPGTGKPMKDRVLVPISNKESWIDLTLESLEYVKG